MTLRERTCSLFEHANWHSHDSWLWFSFIWFGTWPHKLNKSRCLGHTDTTIFYNKHPLRWNLWIWRQVASHQRITSCRVSVVFVVETQLRIQIQYSTSISKKKDRHVSLPSMLDASPSPPGLPWFKAQIQGKNESFTTHYASQIRHS